MLATMVQDYGNEWEGHLAKECFAYNTCTHGFTPFYQMCGRQAKIPIDFIFGLPEGKSQHQSQYARTLHQSLYQAYLYGREKLQTQAQQQKQMTRKLISLCYACITKIHTLATCMDELTFAQ